MATWYYMAESSIRGHLSPAFRGAGCASCRCQGDCPWSAWRWVVFRRGWSEVGRCCRHAARGACGLSAGRAGEGCGIGPFADAALDEALGLAVGLGGIGPGSPVGDAVMVEGGGEQPASVGWAAVGHDAPDGDAVPPEAGEAAAQEGGDVLALAGQQLRIGETRAVIDGDVQVFPPQATACGAPVALAGAVAGDAVSDAVDAAERPDVDVDQLAGPLAFMADDGRTGAEGAGAAQGGARRPGGDADGRSGRRGRARPRPRVGSTTCGRSLAVTPAAAVATDQPAARRRTIDIRPCGTVRASPWTWSGAPGRGGVASQPHPPSPAPEGQPPWQRQLENDPIAQAHGSCSSQLSWRASLSGRTSSFDRMML